MIPINLVLFPLMSDVRYEIKTPLPDVRLEILTEKTDDPYVTKRHTKLILVDLVDDEDEEIRVLRLLILQL